MKRPEKMATVQRAAQRLKACKKRNRKSLWLSVLSKAACACHRKPKAKTCCGGF
jgi:hypothetical protein